VLVLLGALVLLAAAPLSAAGRPLAPTSADRPASRIAFGIWYVDGTDRGQILTVRADGRGGVRPLVPGMHNWLGCQSADGRKMAYYSDREAPHEQFVYIANADGTHADKITEKQVGLECPFSERWLLLSKQIGRAMTIVRHDLQTGAEKTVATNVDYRRSLSPDGTKLLYVGGLDYTPVRGQLRPKGKETIELLDMTTLERRRLAGPLPRTKSFRFECSCLTSGWSPDGRRIAYTIGPSIFADERWAHEPPALPRARSYAVYVRRISRGAARLVLRLSGGPPSIFWSADGTRLLVCADSRGRRLAGGEACIGGAGRPKGEYFSPKFVGKLLLVDLARHSVRRVVSGRKLLFAQWAPSGRSYAYATTAAAYVASPGGVRRKLASAKGCPCSTWPSGPWMGWSPDGRYIGLGSVSSRLAVLNAKTGQMRVLARDRKGEFFNLGGSWWRLRHAGYPAKS
jgi:hypothetical protein